MANWLLAAGVVAFAVSIAVLITLFVAWPAELWSMVDVQVYLWGGHLPG
jgi:hypothetical protein